MVAMVGEDEVRSNDKDRVVPGGERGFGESKPVETS